MHAPAITKQSQHASVSLSLVVSACTAILVVLSKLLLCIISLNGKASFESEHGFQFAELHVHETIQKCVNLKLNFKRLGFFYLAYN